MHLNLIGITAAAATFLGIWLGHVAVRKIEYVSTTVLFPSSLAFLLGVIFQVGAIWTDNQAVSTSLGILGVTLLWDSLEFWRQQNRVEKGHAPANPDNPRHQRILANSPHATTIDWLNRKPSGRRLSSQELQVVQEETR